MLDFDYSWSNISFEQDTDDVHPSIYLPFLEKNKEHPSEWYILESYKYICNQTVLSPDAIAQHPDLEIIKDLPSRLLDSLLQEDLHKLALDRTKDRKSKRRQLQEFPLK